MKNIVKYSLFWEDKQRRLVVQLPTFRDIQ